MTSELLSVVFADMLRTGSAFGNSLGYVIGDGSKVAADSTPFDGTLETSEREIAVFTDKVCDGNCEYTRPNATSHFKFILYTSPD